VYAPHPGTEPRGTTGVRLEPHQHAITPARRALVGITRRTRSRRHDARWLEPPTAHDHGRHDGLSAPRAIEPRRHNGHRHDGPANHACITSVQHDAPANHACTTGICTTETGTTGVHKSRPMDTKRRADYAPQPPNGLPISRRKRTAATVKMPMISCAQRSAAWACSAAAIQVASLVEYP